MEFPGEKLVIRLWETLAEKGVGGLLKPWQDRRTGAAQADVRANELIVLAKAKVEADRIASEASIYPRTPRLASDQSAIGPVLDFDPVQISNIVERKDASQSLRREVNVAEAVLVAEEVLARSDEEPKEPKVDDDWLQRWEHYAGQVSADELQELWGRVLAGEIKEPGTKSLRLLEFLKVVSKEDAQLIELLGPFVFNNLIAKDQSEYLSEKGLDFGNLLRLQELGIVSSVDSIGIQVEYASTDSTKFLRVFRFGEKAIFIEHEDVKKRLAVPAYGITSLGKQALSLGSFDSDYEYLILIAKAIAKLGFSVKVGYWERLSVSSGRLINPVNVEA